MSISALPLTSLIRHMGEQLGARHPLPCRWYLLVSTRMEVPKKERGVESFSLTPSSSLPSMKLTCDQRFRTDSCPARLVAS